MGQDGLAIIVARLPRRDPIDQQVPDCGRLPDLVFAGGGRHLGLSQPFRELPTTELFFHEGLIELPHHGRFRWFNHHLGGTAVALGQRAVPVTPLRPGPELAAPGLLQPSSSGAFVNLGALILGHQALQLGEQFALGRIAKGVLQKDPLQAQLLELLKQEPLRGRVAGPPIRRQDYHRIKFPPLGTVAESIQRRPVEPCAADPFLYILMLGQQAPALRLAVECEGVHLAGAGAFLVLVGRRDSGVKCHLQGVPPGVPQ